MKQLLIGILLVLIFSCSKQDDTLDYCSCKVKETFNHSNDYCAFLTCNGELVITTITKEMYQTYIPGYYIFNKGKCNNGIPN